MSEDPRPSSFQKCFKVWGIELFVFLRMCVGFWKFVPIRVCVTPKQTLVVTSFWFKERGNYEGFCAVSGIFRRTVSDHDLSRLTLNDLMKQFPAVDLANVGDFQEHSPVEGLDDE